MSKTTERENGTGTTFIILIIVLIIVVVGVGIWQLTKKSSNNTPNTSSTSTSTNSASSVCLKAVNSSSFCSFAGHTNISSKQYVAMGTATYGTATSTYSVENDGKGNTAVSYSSSGKQISEITLDGSTYLQSGAGTTWLEYSGSGLGSAASVPNPVSGFNLNFTNNIPKGVSVDSDGTAACGNLSCYKYKVNVASTADATQYVYFDTSNYLLRRWTFSDSSTRTSVDLTFSYQTINITKPSPVEQIST